MAESSYTLLGRSCSRDEYVAFKNKLKLSEHFIDERLPATLPRGRGGFGALWDAVDPETGRKYIVNESMIDGQAHHAINPA